MIESTNLKNYLSKAFCSKCGNSLDTAKLVPLGDMPLAFIAHATCQNCASESMITVTSLGAGVMPLESDLTPKEVARFMEAPAITNADVLKLHKKLKKTSLCNLLLKKEQNLEKIQKN